MFQGDSTGRGTCMREARHKTRGGGKETGCGRGKGRINVFRKHEEAGGPPR